MNTLDKINMKIKIKEGNYNLLTNKILPALKETFIYEKHIAEEEVAPDSYDARANGISGKIISLTMKEKKFSKKDIKENDIGLEMAYELVNDHDAIIVQTGNLYVLLNKWYGLHNYSESWIDKRIKSHSSGKGSGEILYYYAALDTNFNIIPEYKLLNITNNS